MFAARPVQYTIPYCTLYHIVHYTILYTRPQCTLYCTVHRSPGLINDFVPTQHDFNEHKFHMFMVFFMIPSKRFGIGTYF